MALATPRKQKGYKQTEIGLIPEDWTVSDVRTVTTHCQYGLSAPLSNHGRYPVVKMDSLLDGYVVARNLKYVDLADKHLDSLKLEKNDILFNRTNSIEHVGRAGIFCLDGEYVFASYLIRLKPNQAVICPHFLNQYLAFGIERLRRLASKGVQQANINATNLLNFKLLLPSIPEQARIAFIPMELVPDEGIFIEFKTRKAAEISSSTYCEAGDLLLAKITPSLENGKQGLIPDNLPGGIALATTEVYPLVSLNIDKLFLYYLLKLPMLRNQLIFSMTGSTGRQRVPKEVVEKLRVPLPTLKEQKTIAGILFSIDEKVCREKAHLAALTTLKQSLMQNLLTGKIRTIGVRANEV